MLAKLGLWFWPSCTRKPLPILNSLPTSYFLCFICCLWRKKKKKKQLQRNLLYCFGVDVATFRLHNEHSILSC